MENTNFIGNFTTIVKLVSMLIAGWTIGLLVSKGLNLPISEEQLSQLIGSIIFLAAGYIDAKYPNTLKIFGNYAPTEGIPEDDFNDN